MNLIDFLPRLIDATDVADVYAHILHGMEDAGSLKEEQAWLVALHRAVAYDVAQQVASRSMHGWPGDPISWASSRYFTFGSKPRPLDSNETKGSDGYSRGPVNNSAGPGRVLDRILAAHPWLDSAIYDKQFIIEKALALLK